MEKRKSTGKSSAIAACILLALAVILGAFGAHALEDKISTKHSQVYETANLYHFIHALGILVLSRFEKTKIANLFLGSGILLFSGSLYLLSTSNLLKLEHLKPILGPITPVGGMLFIIGWIVAAINLKNTPNSL